MGGDTTAKVSELPDYLNRISFMGSMRIRHLLIAKFIVGIESCLCLISLYVSDKRSRINGV